ncbi:MAG: hypothetical protein SF123_09595 [Chloroflexota bacterium]|nr:hypothetical protein [Chloroflexota bacterium]
MSDTPETAASVPQMKLDLVSRNIVLASGERIPTLKMNWLLVERVRANEDGKPKPPIRDVTLAGGKLSQEANPYDPEYIEALQAWELARNLRFLVYLISKGVNWKLYSIDGAWRQENSFYFSETTTEDEWRYLYIASKFEDPDDFNAFVALLSGSTSPTPEGIAEAKETFQSDD